MKQNNCRLAHFNFESLFHHKWGLCTNLHLGSLEYFTTYAGQEISSSMLDSQGKLFALRAVHELHNATMGKMG